jgi:hypothetical protein
MHEVLWAGVELKVQYAEFHLQRMVRSLEPPEQTATNVAIQAARGIIDTGWQRSFYPHVDAFLSTARSVPEIIQCCFGEDRGNPVMKAWFNKLPAPEQARRKNFKKHFQTDQNRFRKLPLSTARDISVHRTGYAQVTVTISGRFGVIHEGGPAKPVPLAETRPIVDQNLAFLATPNPVRPAWTNFYIHGQLLFPACQDYLNRAQDLVVTARRLSGQVHGTDSLTPPPS